MGQKHPSSPKSWQEAWSLFRDAAGYRNGVLTESIATLPEAAPRRVPGRTPSVLALHGYTGVPQEVELVVQAAAKLGLLAYAPVLPGHGTSPRDLAHLRFDDFLSKSRTYYAELAQKGPVIVIGLSLGSVLAAALAIENPDTTLGLGILANAFWLRSPFPSWPLVCFEKLPLADFGMLKMHSDLSDQGARESHVSYHVQPVRAAASVQAGGAYWAERLHQLRTRTLILHGAKDRVCPVENALRVGEAITDAPTRTVIFPRSHHILTRDVEREMVYAEIFAFLRSLSAP